MRAWLRYAAVSVVVVLVLAAGVATLMPGVDGRWVWVAAGLAYVVQLGAFALLVVGKRRPPTGFLLGWGGGMAVRGAAVLGGVLWVTLADGPHPESLLLSLVAFMIVLALIEPLFLKMAD